EPGERPQLLVRRPAPLDRRDEGRAQLGTRRRRKAFAAPDRLPHLAQLLRSRARALRPAASDERGAHLREEMLLLSGGEPTGDALPEVPPLRATLRRARVTEHAREHAVEPPDPHLVPRVTESRPQEEAGQVEPARLVDRRSRARRLEPEEDVPERPDRREWPGVAPGVERRLEPARERDGIVAALESAAERAGRLLDAHGIDHEPALA